ncbi:hypothetical protein I6H56_10715 [Fusobacterium canifelinum]|uniref:Uncharacterized protein n=1 Tax=Fusobacterium canifelinum TaxID=285729 RepID=A0A7T4FNJ1_9FUSO|nr:hypothetical protein [Fusobacterium canifelinum]QQB73767.1 hypothetical protein I6H56_10715 [Fusobacterium canifelinum]
MIDKKTKRLFLKYMENKASLNLEEIEHIKEMALLREDTPVIEKEFVTNLEKMLTKISLEEVSNAFLYSLSTRDLNYRYILASYIYARSWFKYDKGKEYKIPKEITATFFNWLKYCSGGIWGEIAKPYYYLSEFLNMEKKIPKEEDYEILKKILFFSDNFEKGKTATMLRNELAKEKLFPSNKDEVTGLLETLGICGILETKEHKGFLDNFTPMFERDSGDLRQYFSYPFHWWKGKDRVNYENVKNIFKITV